jgi:hypothetical protein
MARSQAAGRATVRFETGARDQAGRGWLRLAKVGQSMLNRAYPRT